MTLQLCDIIVKNTVISHLNLRSPPSPGYGCVLVDCSGESDPMISPTESIRVADMPEHGPPPPDRRVGCTGPGRAGGVRVGACGRRGDWKTSLRATQPRRSGSQMWCSADARAESRGLSKPRCKRCLPGSPRSGEGELRGSCISRSYRDVVTIANSRGGCLSDPSVTLARRLCGPGPFMAVGPG